MLLGSTRIGKTEFARSLGKHIYMCGQWDLGEWDSSARYLVIDDISFEFWHAGRKALWGGQQQLVLTDKYARKRTVKWGKPMIYLCNPDQDWRYMMKSTGRGDQRLLTASEIDYYEENAVIVNLGADKLYV